MRVEHHDHLRRPVSAQTTRVLVYDDFDNPICLVVQVQPGHCQAYHIGDDDFNEQLLAHGADRVVLVNKR